MGRFQDSSEQTEVTDAEQSLSQSPKPERRNRRYSSFPEGVINLPTIHEEPEDIGEGPSLPVKLRYANTFVDEGYVWMEKGKTWAVKHEDEADDDSLLKKKRVLPPLPPYY